MSELLTAFLHYSAPPVIGGVEAVMEAHARLFLANGNPVAILAGEGDETVLPGGANLIRIPELSTQHPEILSISAALEGGRVPPEFDRMVERIRSTLARHLPGFDRLIVHNVFTKHFNLPLTSALFHLLDTGTAPRTIAWCHDFTWTSPASRGKLHSGYPWDLLRAYRPDLTYVTVSKARQEELAGLLDVDREQVRVVYNGVDPAELLGLNAETLSLSRRLDLLESDLILLMPVRVTRAKNIELAMRVTAALKRRGLGQVRTVLTGPPDPHSSESMDYFQSLLELRRELGVEEEFRFVYGTLDEARIIRGGTVGEMYRLADALFMSSLREGFGMPVLEAGLAGIPAAVSERVPAACELGKPDVWIFSPSEPPEKIAAGLLDWLETIPAARFKRRVRTRLTWKAIYEREIKPILWGPDGANSLGSR